MSLPARARMMRRASLPMLLVCLAAGAFAATPAFAEPVASGPMALSRIANPSQWAQVGPIVASLETSGYATPADSPYAFTATVDSPKKIDQVLLRFRVFRPSNGRMMIQRTIVLNDVEPGMVQETFARRTDDLDLRPDSYPVTLEVRVSDEGKASVETIESRLFVYDPEAARVPVVLSVHLSGAPMRDPNGRFVSDPAIYTRARDEAHALADWVTRDPQARVVAAISPSMLDEWSTIADGYETVTPEGVRSISATSAVSVAYAEAVSALKRAASTGRMEITASGYSDPDLCELSEAGLLGDTETQLSLGNARLSEILGSEISSGLAPAGSCLPPEVRPMLQRAGVGYVIARPLCVRAGKKAARPGAYRIESSDVTALVTDRPLSASLVASPTMEFIEAVVDDRLDSDDPRELVLQVELGSGATRAATLVAAAQVLERQSWSKLTLGSEIAAAPISDDKVVLSDRTEASAAPEGYWQDVADARRWARGIGSALGVTSERAIDAEHDSLMAESSAWAGNDGRWLLADRGAAYGDAALRGAKSILGKVSIHVNSVTLPGNVGKVPVTIDNESDVPLNVEMKFEPTGGINIDPPLTRPLELQPDETFLELDVDLRNAINGTLDVAVVAGEVTLDRQEVTVRASYLNSLAIVVGIVIALLGGLALIIRRVRAAEDADTGK